MPRCPQFGRYQGSTGHGADSAFRSRLTQTGLRVSAPSSRSLTCTNFERDGQVQSMGSFVDAGATFECGSDRILSRLVLLPDSSAGQNETSQPPPPKRLRIRDEEGRGVL